MNHIESGKLKAIAVTGQNRITALPQPTIFADAGLLAFTIKTWNSVLTPVHTPPPIVNKSIGSNRHHASIAQRRRAAGFARRVASGFKPDQLSISDDAQIGFGDVCQDDQNRELSRLLTDHVFEFSQQPILSCVMHCEIHADPNHNVSDPFYWDNLS